MDILRGWPVRPSCLRPCRTPIAAGREATRRGQFTQERTLRAQSPSSLSFVFGNRLSYGGVAGLRNLSSSGVDRGFRHSAVSYAALSYDLRRRRDHRHLRGRASRRLEANAIHDRHSIGPSCGRSAADSRHATRTLDGRRHVHFQRRLLGAQRASPIAHSNRRSLRASSRIHTRFDSLQHRHRGRSMDRRTLDRRRTQLPRPPYGGRCL